jgi:hypothetical protein
MQTFSQSIKTFLAIDEGCGKIFWQCFFRGVPVNGTARKRLTASLRARPFVVCPSGHFQHCQKILPHP